MAQQDEDQKRKALKDRIRPRVREKLLAYCDENGYVTSELPAELKKQGKRLDLFKCFDLGVPDPKGYAATWWFVRLHDGKGYVPPNIDQYGAEYSRVKTEAAS